MCTPLIGLTSRSMMNEVHALHSLAALKPMEGYSSHRAPAFFVLNCIIFGILLDGELRISYVQPYLKSSFSYGWIEG